MKRRWIAEDGTEHESKQAAVAHDTKTKLVTWFSNRAADLDLSGTQREKLVDEMTKSAAELVALLKPFVPPRRRNRKSRRLEEAA